MLRFAHISFRTAMLAALGMILTAAVLPAAVAVADDALPAAREVVDRFVAAAGGKERLMARQFLTTTGTFAIPAQGLQGKLEVHTKAPDLMAMSVEIPGYGKIRSGYDGNTGWMVDPAMGAQVMADEPLAQMRDQANFWGSLYRDEDYRSLTVVGRSEFQGTACWELAVVTRNGMESMQYFAIDSGLLLGMQQTQHTPMGAIPSTTVLKDYREVDGVLVPMVMEQSMMGMTQVMTIESVSFEPIPAEVFALPADIAALVDKE